MYSLRFFKGLIANPGAVGAISASTPYVGQMLVDAAHVRDAQIVLEFGPGTGVVTEVLLDALRPDATFMAFEVSDEFVRVIRDRFPHITLHHDSAENARKHLEAIGQTHCDAIVSGLPWTVFDDQLQNSLLDAIMDVLRPGGHFSTFMYFFSPALPKGRSFLQKLRQRMVDVERLPIVLRNFPPAYVFRARRP